MPSTLQETSRHIVKNSIRSAICIDDSYLSFEKIDNPGILNSEEPRDLYLSFRRDGHCDLDIYTFETFEKYREDDYLLKNKDLLVLDWELDAEQSSLKILEEVISSQEIPFVVIYTATQDLHDVSKELTSHFSPFDGSTFDDFIFECEELFPEKESTDLFESSEFKSLCYDFFYFFEQKDTTESKLADLINRTFEIGDKTLDSSRILRKFFSKFKNQEGIGIEKLLHLSLSVASIKTFSYCIQRVFTGEFLFQCNGINIAIFHKKGETDGIEPNSLFSKFSESLIARPNNFLSLLSIELKDALRQEFSKIGVKFSAIDERAFFFHLNNYRIPPKSGDYDLDSGYDFILKGWLHEMYQFQMGRVPKILNYAQEYFEANVISEIPSSINSDDNFLTSLVKYSALVSNVNLESRDIKDLRFGDLFFGEENQYFLCITPSCDCLRPETKINNNFYFIEGTSFDKKKALKYSESDEKHVSFTFLPNGEPISIIWITKPFTSYIVNSSNNIDSLKLPYRGTDVELTHLTILKENFVQRIANASFGYGYRIGIDLPHT